MDSRRPGPPGAARWAMEYAMTAYQEYFRHRQWSIGLVRGPIHRFLDPGFRPRIEWIEVPSRDEYMADPFGLLRGGRLCVLCERFDRGTKKGTLVAFDWPTHGNHAAPRAVLSLEAHASYPFLIEQDGQVYCVPETFGSQEIGLYRAESYPERWTRVATLIRGFPGVDTSLFQFDGRWWMSSTHAGAPDRRLYLWHAEQLEGPWQPHPRNPVKDDAASARPAGTPFAWRGTLYRPAQDCSKTYGGRVTINAVEQLTPDAFEEHVHTHVEPDRHGPYRLGLHTLSSVGEVTLLDGLRNVFSWTAFGQRVALGLARRRGPRDSPRS